MRNEERWSQAKNILCIRLDSIGDVLMSSPAIRALRQNRPGRTITLLTSQAGASVAPLIEEIDQAISYEAPWMKASAPGADGSGEQRMIERLKRPKFDAAVIFTTYSQNPLPSAMMAFLADIPLRLAYCRENPYQLLTDWLPETDTKAGFGMRHEVQRQLDLVESVGNTAADERIRISVPQEAFERARCLLREIQLDTSRPWLIFHPGASAPSRRYPAESFAMAAQELAEGHGFQVVFTGSAAETELVESIRATMPAKTFSLAGRLDVQELAALISLAPMLVSNNTGPVHIAAGVQTPVVDLYALTNPQHTPWMLPHRTLYHDVPCRFCYKSICPMGHQDCLRKVSPHAVVEAALELMGELESTAGGQGNR